MIARGQEGCQGSFGKIAMKRIRRKSVSGKIASSRFEKVAVVARSPEAWREVNSHLAIPPRGAIAPKNQLHLNALLGSSEQTIRHHPPFLLMNIEFYPSRASRDFTSDQLVNVGGRLEEALRDPASGLPSTDAVGQALAKQIGVQTVHLGLRMRMERKGQFTKDKAREEKLRDKYVVSIRKGIRAILTDNDPALPPARLQAAGLLRDLLEKRPKQFETKSDGENTTQLEFFFADFDTLPAQAALKETDLLRYYQPLKQAHAAYIQLVKDEEAADAAAAVALPTVNPSKLPEMRVIKETLTTRIRLALDLIGFMAELGIAPYVGLAESCSSIIAEASLVAKGRDTREKKAKAPKDGLTA